MKEYVTKVAGQYQVGQTRVLLDSLVHLFREGMSVDGMVECYPALTLEEVHGALAFYRANQRDIDLHLAASERKADAEHEASRRTNEELIAKLRRARLETQIPGGR